MAATLRYSRSVSAPEREIPQRELRNDVARVLREVAGGARLTMTVRGKPVAELVPVGSSRRSVPRREILEILREAPLDRGFAHDLEAVVGATIEEL